MEIHNPTFFVVFGFVLLLSCNSNSLKQADAENTIRKFLANNSIETSKENVSPQTIKKIGKTNIYSQFNTSVRAYFTNKKGNEFIILFIFTRTPDNKWFLRSIEAETDVSQELKGWIKARKNLNVAVN